MPLNENAAKWNNEFATIEHIIPRMAETDDSEENLALACRRCNSQRLTNPKWTPIPVARSVKPPKPFGTSRDPSPALLNLMPIEDRYPMASS